MDVGARQETELYNTVAQVKCEALLTYLNSLEQPVVVDYTQWATTIWYVGATKRAQRHLAHLLLEGRVRIVAAPVFTVEVVA